MKYARFEDLPVWKDAVSLARQIYDLTVSDIFRKHPGFRDQLERAGLSISNNVAEGFERGSTNELLAFLYIARGSAGEVRSMLCVLEGWKTGNNFKSQISDLKRKSECISRQLFGWIETLKNSNITGQRHLNDKAKAFSTVEKERVEFLDHLRQVSESGHKGGGPEI
jgi:four helix bundle protein